MPFIMPAKALRNASTRCAAGNCAQSNQAWLKRSCIMEWF